MLKARIEVWYNSPGALPRAVARAWKFLGHVRRFVLNPRIRSEQMTRLRFGGRQYQRATYTAANRYPQFFTACARHLAATPAPAILSFGCSTGEEAFSLAAAIPNATVLGVDINPWCLRQCLRKPAHPRVRFLHALSREFAAAEPFDAIFAMAVFQRTENRTEPAVTAQGGFTFQLFEQEIARLDRRLKPGGLLFLDHADFRFADTATAARYTPIDCQGSPAPPDRPIFDRDNRVIAGAPPIHRAFLKRAEAS